MAPTERPRVKICCMADPAEAVPELRGTGRRHDWALSRVLREAAPVPLFLAGGLTPENVAEAVETVRPYRLDVCSGARRAPGPG